MRFLILFLACASLASAQPDDRRRPPPPRMGGAPPMGYQPPGPPPQDAPPPTQQQPQAPQGGQPQSPVIIQQILMPEGQRFSQPQQGQQGPGGRPKMTEFKDTFGTMLQDYVDAHSRDGLFLIKPANGDSLLRLSYKDLKPKDLKRTEDGGAVGAVVFTRDGKPLELEFHAANDGFDWAVTSVVLRGGPKVAAAAAVAAAPPPARTESATRAPKADPLIPSYTSKPQPNDFAIVIGVEKYSEIAPAPYAEGDAALMKSHLLALGVPERNIIHLAGNKAGRTSIEKYVESWLPRLVKPESRVYFYFSGHGAPDVKTGQAYLVPWDGDPNYLETTGYSVARLYKQMQALPAKHVLIAMDACFSGAGGRSVLATGARPLVSKIETGSVGGRVTALTASGANEISGTVEEARHGAFTYFLAQGLNTAVDGSGRVTARSLHDYLTPLVQDEARRLNRDQTPQLMGESDFVVR